MTRPPFAMRLLYVTTQDKNQALSIGRVLITEHLAACVNIIDDMTSMYRWQGAIEEASETVLIVKTSADRVDDATQRIKELHTYEVPCIITISVESGHAPYLDWVRDSL
jgi:periplasmic divalent cation tolerance protein